MLEDIRVRLKTDLTRYHRGLIVGAEGVTVGQFGLWSRAQDRFIGVKFDKADTRDILWESLEIIEPEKSSMPPGPPESTEPVSPPMDSKRSGN